MPNATRGRSWAGAIYSTATVSMAICTGGKHLRHLPSTCGTHCPQQPAPTGQSRSVFAIPTNPQSISSFGSMVLLQMHRHYRTATQHTADWYGIIMSSAGPACCENSFLELKDVMLIPSCFRVIFALSWTLSAPAWVVVENRQECVSC